MNKNIKVYSFFCAAVLALVLGVVMLVTMVAALTVETTLAAVESAFGSFVLAILLLVAARRLYDAGRKRMETAL